MDVIRAEARGKEVQDLMTRAAERTMLAIPAGRGSWDFRVMKGSHPFGKIHIDAYADKGSIDLLGAGYDIVLAGVESYEMGMLMGTFELRQNGRILASAVKEAGRQRYFILSFDDSSYIINYGELLPRHVRVFEGSQVIGKVRPRWPYSRHARIELPETFSDIQKMFVTWVALLCWKRGKIPVRYPPLG